MTSKAKEMSGLVVLPRTSNSLSVNQQLVEIKQKKRRVENHNKLLSFAFLLGI